MKLVCGLGNPGSQYEFTRHNLGFLVIDGLAVRMGSSVFFKEKDGAQIAQVDTEEGEKLLLVKPYTYMNCSGEPLQKIVRFFKVALGDVVVVHDEIDLPLGRIQVRRGGGSGGHNGLKSIDSHLGTKDYFR
ncbi:MAG: aminoacyl-tRNA hydrolase, partial [Bdellovibrionales bacterium]|nr:aminoacyl-tRNA hydrolase [Bdellovibrionales bacterium]